MDGIGSRYDVITKRKIRYNGTLTHYDDVKLIIKLENVRCYGTEQRDLVNPILEQDKIFQYIEFKGEELHDIIPVIEKPTENNLDPAILGCGEIIPSKPNSSKIPVSVLDISLPKSSSNTKSDSSVKSSVSSHTSVSKEYVPENIKKIQIQINDFKPFDDSKEKSSTKINKSIIKENINKNVSSNTTVSVSDRPKPKISKDFDFGATLNQNMDKESSSSTVPSRCATEEPSKKFDPNISFFDDLSYELESSKSSFSTRGTNNRGRGRTRGRFSYKSRYTPNKNGNGYSYPNSKYSNNEDDKTDTTTTSSRIFRSTSSSRFGRRSYRNTNMNRS